MPNVHISCKPIFAAAAVAMMSMLPGARINAQVFNIERFVMPGPVIEAHASVEESCSSCHVSDESSEQAELCGTCHAPVLADRRSSGGFHGLHPDASSQDCAACHQEHEGRDAQAVQFSAEAFNHFFTDFPLVGAHQNLACSSCHDDARAFREAPQRCTDCHGEQDVHAGALGASCVSCHSAEGWQFVQFDHSTTMFALSAGHQDVACEDCHRNQTFVGTPLQCASCHREDDVHDGRNGAQCADCHSATAWTDTSFEHWMVTGFALQGQHRDLTCQSCHTTDLATALPQTCAGCHAGRDVHAGSLGDDCAACHSESQWAVSGFDHLGSTGFGLAGAHARAQCNDCHGSGPEVALARECAGCHTADPHQGQLGADCGDCHAEIAWTADLRFDHGLGAFPLIGAHAEVACAQCHATPAFHDAAENCADCHSPDDHHAGTLGEACATCHSPVAWQAWMFDHSTVSNFPLTGAHSSLSCDSCHQQALGSMLAAGTTCASCHRNDDPHDGLFGSDCSTCHSTEAF